MPTIIFSLKDLSSLVGKKISLDELKEYVGYGKGEVDNYDKSLDEVSVSFGDTNLPYLWSVEGVSRLIKGLLGEKGIPKLKINKADYKIIVDKNIKEIRPFIGGFVAKGKKVDDYLIKQLVQLQEKLAENFGRKREQLSVGIYSYDKITFPLYYKATDPESVKFIPLEFRKEMTQQEILEEHPKGKEYAFILKNFKKYPLFVDSKNKVLSFPPIINSNYSGKINIGDENLFVEVTGTDEEAVNLALNILAYAFFDRGFTLYGTEVKYENKSVYMPYSFNDKIKIKKEQLKELIGIELKDSEVKNILEKARYDFDDYTIKIPDYRRDIMHPVDIIEDAAVFYGYDKIQPLPLTTYTIGRTFEINKLIGKIRDIGVGAGYQELLSNILTNKELLYIKTKTKDLGTIEINEPMSETYSILRTWIIPLLLQSLAENKHNDYPQKLFETGLVTLNKQEIKDYEKVAFVSAHNKANFTEIKQLFDLISSLLNIKLTLEEKDYSIFIPGRSAAIIFNKKEVGMLGEVHPGVLNNFSLDVPVAALELNLTEIF